MNYDVIRLQLNERLEFYQAAGDRTSRAFGPMRVLDAAVLHRPTREVTSMPFEQQSSRAWHFEN